MKKWLTPCLAIIAVVAIIFAGVNGSQKGNLTKQIGELNSKIESLTADLDAAKQEAEAAKISKKHEKSKLPVWVTVTMIVIFIVLVAILVLMNTTMKDNLVFGQIATIIIGVCCGVLFYMRRYTKNPDSKFQDVLYVVLAVMAVVMTFMGAYGLLRVL